MFKNQIKNMGLSFCLLLSSAAFAKQGEMKVNDSLLSKTELLSGVTMLTVESDKEGQTISDFESAQKACKDFVGGYLPDAKSLKEIVKELGTRLQPAFYWSTTIVTGATDCAAKECRVQVEAPTLNERNENALNQTGAAICITESEEK